MTTIQKRPAVKSRGSFVRARGTKDRCAGTLAGAVGCGIAVCPETALRSSVRSYDSGFLLFATIKFIDAGTYPLTDDGHQEPRLHLGRETYFRLITVPVCREWPDPDYRNAYISGRYGAARYLVYPDADQNRE